MDEQAYIDALICLHGGLIRQGPGDTGFSEFILSELPELPQPPRIADIGCGAGVGALMLARYFNAEVKAVDLSREFLDQLMQHAEVQCIQHLIDPVEADMGALEWPPGSVDLLWSEGAAYSIGFDNAMTRWLPLLSAEGVAVVSEMSYFSDAVPADLSSYIEKAYPAIRRESGNLTALETIGYEVIATYRLPSEAWWDYYYEPLKENMESMRDNDDEVMQQVMRDTGIEMDMFRQYDEYFGYTFYVMKLSG